MERPYDTGFFFLDSPFDIARVGEAAQSRGRREGKGLPTYSLIHEHNKDETQATYTLT